MEVPPTRPNAKFDGLTCSFRISRRIIDSGSSGELATGTFDIKQDRVINMEGSWTTVGPVLGDAFGGAELTFAADGGLRGILTVYPLFAQTEMEVPPAFTVSLDGSSTTTLDRGPVGATRFLVDQDKIEVHMTVYGCK